MSNGRRDFLLFSSLLAAVDANNLAAAVSRNRHDDAAADFWSRGMGVKLSGDAAGVRGPTGPSSVAAFAQEPIFLHYHEQEKTFIPSDAMPKNYLLPDGDTQVSMQMTRLRLNAGDNSRFARYTSGGVYFELQQSQATDPAAIGAFAGELVQLASSVFSAFVPGGHAAKSSGKEDQSTTKKGKSADKPDAKKNSGNGFLAADSASQTKQAGAPIALQTAKQAQTLTFPNGAGKAAFSAFVKDPRKSVFGQLFSLLGAASDGTNPVYAQLLSIPLLAAPGLASIRAIVAGLQLQGGSQQVLMQCPPRDVATTAPALDLLSQALPLRQGAYLVIARDHAGVTLDEIRKHKLMNGFLVPKEITGDMDVSPDVVMQAAPALSYLTVAVGVTKAKSGSCLAPKL